MIYHAFMLKLLDLILFSALNTVHPPIFHQNPIRHQFFGHKKVTNRERKRFKEKQKLFLMKINF